METLSPSLAAQRFTSLIEEICHTLTKHGRARFIAAPMLLLIWNRIFRMARLFTNLAERVHAGTLSETAPARSRGASARPARVQPAERLPGHFGWLVNMLPEAAARGGDLCWLLRRPEIQDLIFAAPQIGRILRPLCRMLGVEPPSALQLPRRARVPRPPETSEQTSEQSSEQASEPAPAPAQPGDNGSQWRAPGELEEFGPEFWKLHPPPKMD
jgi:hypothetical protein